AAFRHGSDQSAGRPRHAKGFRHRVRHFLKLGSYEGAFEEITAVLGRLHESANEIGRDCEADADRTAAAAVDRSVDTDKFPSHVDQAAARITRINGGIGLDEEPEIGNAD